MTGNFQYVIINQNENVKLIFIFRTILVSWMQLNILLDNLSTNNYCSYRPLTSFCYDNCFFLLFFLDHTSSQSDALLFFIFLKIN